METKSLSLDNKARNVYGFGFNGFSQLNSVQPEGKHGRLLEASPTIPRPLSHLTSTTEVEASWATALYLQDNGQVTVMGWIPGTDNQGYKEDLLRGKQISGVSCSWKTLLFLSTAGEAFIWTNFTSTKSHASKVTVPNGNTKFDAVSCGESHCILVTDTGQVGHCPENKQDQAELRVPVFQPLNFQHRVTSVDCGKEHVLLLTSAGSLYSYGNGSRGQLGHGLTEAEESPRLVEAVGGIRVVRLAAGGWHSAAITEYGDLYMWGWNQSGQLGLQSDPDESQGVALGEPIQRQMVAVPLPVDFPKNLEVTAVSCGSRHSAAITGDGSLWTWGWGRYGQLGHGDSTDRRTPTRVEFFSASKSKLASVSCGEWNTLAITTA